MITEGYLVRHYQGAPGARGAAQLDVAQDRLLMHLHAEGLFDQGLVFKGGIALRKFRAGNLGRFSTDLDFSAPDGALALDALSLLMAPRSLGFGSPWNVSGMRAVEVTSSSTARSVVPTWVRRSTSPSTSSARLGSSSLPRACH